MTRDELDAMTVEQLTAFAAEHEIDLAGAKRKAELVDAILAASGDAPAPVTEESDQPDDVDGSLLSVAFDAPLVIGHAAYHFEGPIRKVVARSGRVDVHYANGDREEILDTPNYHDAGDFQRQYEERFGVKLEPRGS